LNKQEDDTKFGQDKEHVASRNQAEHGRANHDSCGYLANDSWDANSV
jgi:hypothetical protein